MRCAAARCLPVLLALLAPLAAPAAADAGPVRLATVTVAVADGGKTRPEALLRDMGLAEGDVFDSIEALEARLREEAERLERRMIFRSFSWEVLPRGPGEADVALRVVDAVTFVPRPMIKYNSTSGLLLGARADYANAFGSLTDHSALAYWSPRESAVRYAAGQLPIGRTRLGVEASYARRVVLGALPDGTVDLEYSVSEVVGSAVLSVPLGGYRWHFLAGPTLGGAFAFEPVRNDTGRPDADFDDTGFSPGATAGFAYDTVRRDGSFRRGLRFGVSDATVFLLGPGRTDSVLETDLIGHLPVSGRLGLGGRAGGFLALSGARTDAGDRLRGVKDYLAAGEWGVFANLQATVLLVDARGLFELQGQAFADAGYVHGQGRPFGPEEAEYTAGVAGLVYLDAVPSLVLSVTYGWDLRRGGGELIIDTAHAF